MRFILEMNDLNRDALVFAGTTEGRDITEFLSRNGVKVTASVATNYGKTAIDENDNVTVDSIRGVDNMAEEMRKYDVVVDATHPYAVRKSANIREACEKSGSKLIRIIRPDSSDRGDVITVPDTASAAEHLKGTDGNVLVTTGSNELAEFTSVPDYKNRIFARVLSLPSVVEKCSELGFQGRNLICMEGPFTEELNYAMMKQIDARYLVTKDSGTAGGFEDKMSAAARADVIPIVIGRPEEDGGVLMGEAKKILSDLFSIEISQTRRSITIVGIGVGRPDGMTQEVKESIATSDLVIGAKRMLESLELNGKDVLIEYRAEEISKYLEENPQFNNITVVMSGDTGYFSGTKGLLTVLDDGKYDIEVLPGISSLSYFFSKIGKSWDDAHLTSAHGREINIVGLSKRNRKLFTLLSGEESVHEMCEGLSEYGLDRVTVTVGQNFGSSDERIVSGSPKEMLDMNFGSLCVALIENPEASDINPIGISDDDFIRGSAPMTKSEVRSLSVAKMKLSSDSVIYDIGAGTGSASIEMALVALSGQVYAIEKEEEASRLIDMNCRKFGTPNVTVVHGLAPEALTVLPIPTHAFIGGSSGNLESIIKLLLERNSSIRIVITSVTLETLSETMRCMKELKVIEEETICVNISKARILGKYHLMTAQNPIYITVCRGDDQ
ncbi:MAG TPA: precorrin-6A reductase [Candidatus Methanomethylophilaceae archaeon]|nr:precorrin-6A reductase [Candidatus Methanomethylophilaceae archaeon]